jgi:hypothetical protein
MSIIPLYDNLIRPAYDNTNYLMKNIDLSIGTIYYVHGTRYSDANSNSFYTCSTGSGIDLRHYYQIDPVTHVFDDIGYANDSNIAAVWGYQPSDMNNARWIWHASNSLAVGPAAFVYKIYYYSFVYGGYNTSTDTTSYFTATLWAIVDDVGNFYINDFTNPIVINYGWNAGLTAGPGVKAAFNEAPYRGVIAIKPGLNQIRVIAVNQGGPAGLLISIYDHTGTNIVNTDARWVVTDPYTNIFNSANGTETKQTKYGAVGYTYTANATGFLSKITITSGGAVNDAVGYMHLRLTVNNVDRMNKDYQNLTYGLQTLIIMNSPIYVNKGDIIYIEWSTYSVNRYFYVVLRSDGVLAVSFYIESVV